MITVKDIREHFLSKSGWVNPESTVDRVIIGDADKEVDRCLVTWIPSFAALRAVVEQNVELLICHEPTFWNHRDDRPENNPRAVDKLNFIKEHDLVVLRNHDCWDRWPDIGIPWAWGKFLDLNGKPAVIGANGYQHRYDIEPVSLDDFARRVAQHCATIGEPMVQVTGDGAMQVSKIGIGTGCGCDINAYLEMECDCSVVCDDGSCYWAGIQMAEDLGHPVIRVNHGTSEEPGMITLTRYINENIEGLSAEHLPHGSTFRLVGI
ncbi:Nif3-like dinuclear metal center hexameric protein [bacterium]|nr:Nif3-like dinuclear metal center hexameric protein [bacterium]